ncbi:ornithine cyclodeaminase family protein [Mesorhizobium sp. WSM2239]|uniref:Ornithine cyclodeaminase family protein n=2 Tax=unclassified Mesorhizobium TaxID=325217 RepID=A0AAU8D3X8_9HYPH
MRKTPSIYPEIESQGGVRRADFAAVLPAQISEIIRFGPFPGIPNCAKRAKYIRHLVSPRFDRLVIRVAPARFTMNAIQALAIAVATLPIDEPLVAQEVFGMIYISEEESVALVTHELAFEAVRRALVAAASKQSLVFPAVLGRAREATNTFSIKSGSSNDLTGVKIGSFWSRNPARGLPRHNSIIVLLDQDTGRLGAVVEAGKVNAYRTAAADAVAADLLARRQAKVLAIFGAGNQAGFEVTALARIRPIETVLVVASPSPRRDAFVDRIGNHGLTARAVPAEEAVRAADIVVTATPSRQPLFDATWVKPGTHIVSMGSDAPGKRELTSELLSRASLFCDLPSQSIQIGEFQHVRESVEAGTLIVTPIGDVIEGRGPGRRSDEEITVFDSSGISLQDLYMAEALIRAKASHR